MSEMVDKFLKIEELYGRGDDPFATRFGPTPDCFSSNDVVRMFQLGALRRDVDHVQDCDFCRERIEAFSRVMEKQLKTAASRPRGWRRWLGQSAKPESVGAPALVHIPSAYAVTRSAVIERVRVQLVAGQVRSLQNVKVRLNGALSAEVPNWSSGNESFPVIEMSNVKPSGKVLEALKRHNRVTEQVVIEVGESLEHPQLTATADVVFMKEV
jgi:hypothetical protein